MHHFHFKKYFFLKKTLLLAVLIAFVGQSVLPLGLSQAQAQQVGPAGGTLLGLPPPGAMVGLTPAYDPALMIGMTVYPEDPFRFDFMVHPGDDNLKEESLRDESNHLIKYFFAAMTVPEDEMWVNLSPYEKDRIIPPGFGATEIGRDLLAQDYLLKQLTASLMYPEKDLGRAFWKRVRDKTRQRYGTNEIPMDTFHKVWIIPDRASVYVSGTSVFVTGSHHKVMLENDYLALAANQGHTRHGLGETRAEDLTPLSDIAKEIIREVIIPEIEREVNTGKSFARLRQISNAVILATWYKRHVAGSVLQDIYIDHNRTAGVDTQDKQINQKIYQQYLEAFKRGVYNFIKEDYDDVSQTVIPRKYFSGGVVEKYGRIDESQTPGDVAAKAARATKIAVQASVIAGKKSGSLRKDGKKKNDSAMKKYRFIDGLGGVPVSMTAEEIILALRAKRGVNNRTETAFKNEFYAQALYKELPDDKKQLIEDILNRYGYEVVDTVATVLQWGEPFFTTNGGMPFDGYSHEEYLEYFPELGLKLIQSSIGFARERNNGAGWALASLKTLKPYLIHSREDVRRILDELEAMYWAMAAESDPGRDFWGIWEIAVDVFGDQLPRYWDDLKEFGILSASKSPGRYYKLLLEVKKDFGDMFIDEIGDIFKLLFKESNATKMGFLMNSGFNRLKEHYGDSFFEYWPVIKTILLNLDHSPHSFIYYQLGGLIGFHGASLSLEQLKIFAEMSSRVHGRVDRFWDLLIRNNIYKDISLDDFRQNLEKLIPLIDAKEPDVGEKEKVDVHKKVEAILKIGKKKVLFVHNLDEGIGDEIIRNGSLVQALLEYNPELEIYIYTKRTEIYNHPRIQLTFPPLFDAEKSDMIIHRYDADGKILSQKAEQAFQDVLKRQPPAIYIHSPYAYGHKEYDVIHVRNDVLDPINSGNQYAPAFDLLDRLGISYGAGNNRVVDGHYMTTVSGSEAHYKRSLLATLTDKNIERRPVVFLNLFGGELETKGLSEYGYRYGAKQVQQLIDSGFFVILMPNMNRIGWLGFNRSEDEKSILHFIPEQYLSFVMVSPVPQPHERGILYLMEAADIVGTVEGGITHMAYALGKHYVSQGFVGMDEDGYDDLSVWISPEHSATQRHYLRKIYMAEHIIELGRELGLIQGTEKDYSARSVSNESSLQSPDKGGIDLNPRNTALRTGGDDVRIRFPAYRGPLPDGSIPGLDPVIMDMQPVTNLAALIGQNGVAAALPVSSPP